MKKTINLKEIEEYIKLAPEKAVERIYRAAAERLNFSVGDINAESSNDIIKGLASAGDFMSSLLNEIEYSPETPTSSLKSQLETTVQAEDALEACKPRDIEATIKIVSRNDQANAADVDVLNEDVIKILQDSKVRCVAIGAYFPYGFGITKKNLRIKNLSKNLKIGHTVKTTLTFYMWNREDKKGFSCYTKK